MVVYKITNLINGKVYIGATVQTLLHRKAGHVYDSKRHNGNINQAIRKYGKDNFKWEMLCVCYSVNVLNEMEKHYISLYDSMNIGYNMTTGGKHFSGSAEYRRNITGENNGMYGKKHSKETRKQYSKVRTGTKRSKETRKRMSIAQIKRRKQEKAK
ncbi:hypothetical protein LCGC14_0365040 [marine sediment metagenome]|uniref:GIY-YIG domain-containing protein n=1 Tax=marine sediment metagenome TaxID=412755 RepID=A0A0F9TPX9_9ZZZZ